MLLSSKIGHLPQPHMMNRVCLTGWTPMIVVLATSVATTLALMIGRRVLDHLA